MYVFGKGDFNWVLYNYKLNIYDCIILVSYIEYR